ncbi:hypothetical protein [Ascidiimonas aurantiaca]|uniref:hypothetical protein n=1 Tax=Ascidiimonas aurantiaca TaxID=1685432 RepID=UPI0030EDBA75
MNDTIKSTLENLLNRNLEVLKSTSLEKMFDEILNENPKVFDADLGVLTDLFDDDDIKNLKKAKKNPKLISAFENAKNMEFDNKEIISALKKDILNSISELKNKIDPKKGLKNQLIFLEYDHEPCAYFYGFGKGNYPILKQPEYFEFSSSELYAGVGKVDYGMIWKELTTINEILEDLDVYDHVWETELYQSLLNFTKFKTYLFLHEAFNQIGIKAFNTIEIEKPLMIYGREHDCEPITVYAFE